MISRHTISFWFYVLVTAYSAFGNRAAKAAVDLDDGTTHTISSSSAQVLLSNGTSLIVVPGASIVSDAIEAGVAAYDRSGYNVVVTGGSITGGSNPQSFGGFAASAIDMRGGTLNISDGLFIGGDASFVPGAGLSTIDTDVTITGGTFFGGQNTIGSISSGNGLQVGGGNYEISGGTFQGAGGLKGGNGAAFGWFNKGNSPSAYALITGGSFIAGSPGFFGTEYSLAVGYNYAYTVDLKGGQFDGTIFVDEGSTLNIFGYDLTANPISSGEHVTGTLLDGSPFSSDVLNNGPVTVTLINVPEPSTIVLAVFGFLGMATLCRRTQ